MSEIAQQGQEETGSAEAQDGRASAQDSFIVFDGVSMRYSTRQGSTLALSDINLTVGR